MKSSYLLSAVCMGSLIAIAAPADASSLVFNTGSPDGLMAAASRPSSAGKIEIEAADDFALVNSTLITKATFTGLIPTGASVSDVRVEIYRVFPNDSDITRTSGAPTFNTPQVPTRVNSPSDVEFADRSASAGTLSFSQTVQSSSFTANNSVLNGIHPSPGFHTGGEGAVTGQEVQFSVAFTTAFNLPADHYFFVPQVQLSNGDFLWLSAPKPITGGTPFPPGFTDLQGWIRNEDLAPDWLRIGTDIVGGQPAPTFNFAFSLEGDPATPLPGAFPLFATGLGVLGLLGWRRKRKAAAVA